MSRSSRRSSRTRRDNSSIANQRLPRTDMIDFNMVSPIGRTDLRGVEDRRTFFPGDRPAASPSRRQHTLIISPNVNRRPSRPLKSGSSYSSSQVVFEDKDTLVCVRRSRRKEVLHALGKSGRSGQRKPRFNKFSSVSCKRRK